MSRTLYEIEADLLAIEDLLDACGGDITDSKVAAAVDEWFAEIERHRTDKVDAYASLILDLQARAVARKEEAKRLSDRARLDDVKAERLKDRLKDTFTRNGWGPVETPRFRVSVVGNGGVLPMEVDESTDPNKLPDEFVIVRREINNAAIRAALEAGRTDVTFARFRERGNRLSIR